MAWHGACIALVSIRASLAAAGWTGASQLSLSALSRYTAEGHLCPRLAVQGPGPIANRHRHWPSEERPSFGSLSRKRAENAAEPRFALFGLRCLFIVFIGLDGIVCGVCTGLRVLDATVRAVQLYSCITVRVTAVECDMSYVCSVYRQ